MSFLKNERIVATVKCLGSAPLLNFETGKQESVKATGELLFQVALESEEIKKISGIDFKTAGVEACKSVVDLKDYIGKEIEVELVSFHMQAQPGSKKLNVYYRIVKIIGNGTLNNKKVA